MAAYDGSIRILTEISTEMAKKSLGILAYTITKTAKEISSLRAKMDVLENQKIPTQEYEDLQSELAKAEENLAKLVAQQDEWEAMGVTSGGSWDTLNEKIATASDNVDSIKEKMQELSDEGKDFTLGKDTAEYANYEKQLKYEQAALERMTRQYQELEKLKDPYARLSQALGDLNKKLNSIRHPIQSIKNAFLSMVENMKARLVGLAASIINVIVHPFQTLKKIGGSAVKGVTKLFSGMITVIKKAGKAISSITSLLKRAISSMLGFGKSTKGSNNVMKSGLKNILKYGLGIRSVYVLVNKLRTAIKEGFTNMSNEIERFKSHVDSLKASTLTLKNSFAAAFRPLVEMAIPYIQMLVDNMSRLLDTVGQFVAAIMGQQTYTKAIKQTTAAIEDENKAQNKQLSGLDKLNNLSSGSTGGADGGASTQMFEENVPISSPMLDMYQRLKELIESEDWEGIGNYIAGALNNGLQKIYNALNWETVGPQVTQFVTAFTGALNGLVDGFNWELLGQTIGAGINTVVNTLSLLITGIDWVSIGSGLANGLNGLANEVDFTNVGNLIGEKFMMLPRILLGFVTNLSWGEIGVQIGNALNGIVNSINLSEIGEMLGTSLTDIFQAAINFSSTFKWEVLGTNIYQGINSFFSNTDWAVVGQGISDFVSGLLDSLIVIIEGTDWQQIGENIKTFIANIDWAGLAERLAEGIGAAIGGLAALIWGLIKDAWNSVVEWWNETASEDGKFTFEGLLNGIVEAVKGIGAWIDEHIFQPFIKGFKSIFGIHSPSTVMAEMGTFLMEGLFNGISSLVDSVISVFTTIKEKISEVWEKVKQVTSDIWGKIKQKISDIWSGIKTLVSTAINNVKTTISNVWTTIKNTTTNVWNGIKGIFNGFTTFLTGVFTGNWKKAWDGIVKIFEGVKTSIKSVINGILGLIESLANGVINGINFVIGALNGLSFDVPKWVPLIGGETFGFNIPELKEVSIPRLATGTVVPPNNEFLAVLGDNKREPEVVSPLSTIEKAVENAMRRNGGIGGGEITIKIPVEIDGNVLFELIKKLDMQQFNRTGRPSFQI